MNVKRLLFPDATESDGSLADPSFSEEILADLELSMSTSVTSDSTIETSRRSESSTAPVPTEDEGEPAWLVPVIISAVSLLVLVVGAFIYRKWSCFGLPLPFIRRKFKQAQPIKKMAGSVRSSVSSTFSSFRGSLLRSEEKQIRKYAVRVCTSARRDNLDGISCSTKEIPSEWLLGKDFSGEFEAVKRADLKDASITVANKAENIFRNRFSNILPYDKTRVILSTSGNGGLCNDYVNANYVSGYRHEKEFICTQGPLKQTAADFWRMCWETEADAIIMLTKCYEKNQEKCYPYWETGKSGSICFGDIKLTLASNAAWKQASEDGDEQDHLWLVSELTMEKEGESKPRNIIHIAFLSWPDFGVVSPECLVGFVRNTQTLIHQNRRRSREVSSQDSQACGPVVVHCSAGVGRSGVFIAVDQLIRQMDDNVTDSDESNVKTFNVFQLVTKMRRERMGMVQNVQQYTLIYKCLHFLAYQRDLKGEEAIRVSADIIQGSDWGLVNPMGK